MDPAAGAMLASGLQARAWAYGLAFSVFWCLVVIRRLPKDIVELRDLWRRYRERDDPAVLARFETEQRRSSHRADYAREFWGTLAMQVFFFWPVTLAVVGFLIWLACGLL